MGKKGAFPIWERIFIYFQKRSEKAKLFKILFDFLKLKSAAIEKLLQIIARFCYKHDHLYFMIKELTIEHILHIDKPGLLAASN
jgi:hypothetical protein